MNLHPVIGANIIANVAKLAPELPIIRHHHEWYNGSGYPDRLIGDEIPKLARVLHVADAFEAMTRARPYRMRPLSTEQAIAELRKYAGVQFDPGDGGRICTHDVGEGCRRRRTPNPASAGPDALPGRSSHDPASGLGRHPCRRLLTPLWRADRRAAHRAGRGLRCGRAPSTTSSRSDFAGRS